VGDIRVCHLDDADGFAQMRATFERDNAGLTLTRVAVDGDAALRTQHGGMRVFWNYRGNGQVLVRRGFRTQEGDGARLPAEYVADPVPPAFQAVLRELQEGLPTVSAAAALPVRAILSRWRSAAFTGDFAGELWKLDHIPRPWSTDSPVEAALKSLFGIYRDVGYSTKQTDSYEEFRDGDQLIVCGEEEIAVRGAFRCLAMESSNRPSSHVSSVRRLQYLADTAGGCNPDFDPFRRLPLTWYYNYPGETGDGLNWVNSHVVNIPKETSPAHFHPPKGIGGISDTPQREMYLVLDPQAYALNTYGRPASLIAFPDLRDLRRYEQYRLEPGMFLYIPPGTGHRGLDVFVNVLTIPGFKPHNEYYIDRDVRDASEGQAPYNENHLASKNYTSIDDLL
jgi:hypothetical protein